MILTEAEIRAALEQVKVAFPHFSDWEYHDKDELDRDYMGFSILGAFSPNPDELQSSYFFITLVGSDNNWAGYLTIGKPAYYWSSTDVGDAYLVDSQACESIARAIDSLKTKIQALFNAFSIGTSKPAAAVTSLADLEAAKLADRQALLAKPPEIAQLEASQVLHPELWRVAEQAIWTERLCRSDRPSALESEE